MENILQAAFARSPCAPLWFSVSLLSGESHLREVRMEVREDKGDVVGLSSFGKAASACCRDVCRWGQGGGGSLIGQRSGSTEPLSGFFAQTTSEVSCEPPDQSPRQSHMKQLL